MTKRKTFARKHNSWRKIANEVLGRLAEHGFRAKIVPVSRLENLKADIEEQRSKGEFDRRFYIERLTFYDFDVLSEKNNLKSIIIVAAPQPLVRMRFKWKGGIIPALIPPTYSTNIDARIKEIVAELLAPAGFQLVRRYLPL